MSNGMLPVEEIDIEPHSVIEADALVLPYEDESFHAVVTDPPYGLAFMGKNWDDFEPKEYQEFCENWARKVRRVLKPGGHLLAFSGNRTHHRLFSGVEDAGFEVRDTITWHYGSGFPKASDISKTIDKRADVEPENVSDAEGVGFMNDDDDGWNDTHNHIEMGEPTTDAAKQWDGWKTGLKPATEYVVVARKPFDGATVDCVLEHGTGALNIDACRVGDDGGHKHSGEEDNSTTETCYGDGLNGTRNEPADMGRYPANVILDIEAAQMLDEEVGESTSAASKEYHKEYGDDSMMMDGESHPGNQYTDTGGPSRFFYTAKASKSERTMNGRIDNPHPTVKPVDLMQYLVRLVTAEGQKVCDPFLGSGTTLLACEEENRIGYGSDMNKKYCDIATKRLGIRLGTELGSFMDY